MLYENDFRIFGSYEIYSWARIGMVTVMEYHIISSYKS